MGPVRKYGNFFYQIHFNSNSLNFTRFDSCSGETLNTTGWASGTNNDRTKQWGNFIANYVYIVPVVYVQTTPKPVANKPVPFSFYVASTSAMNRRIT